MCNDIDAFLAVQKEWPEVATSTLAQRLWQCYRLQSRLSDPAERAEREAMIFEQLPVVSRLAREQKRIFLHVPFDDLYQAGCCGLVEAADRYEPQPSGFARFAYFRIRGAIIDSQKRQAWREFAKSVSSDAIAERFDGWLPGDIAVCRDPLPDELIARDQVRSQLAAALRELPDQDSRLLRAWMSGESVGKQCRISGMNANYTRSRVEQIIGRVRAMFRSELPQPYVQAAGS